MWGETMDDGKKICAFYSRSTSKNKIKSLESCHSDRERKLNQNSTKGYYDYLRLKNNQSAK